MKSLRVYCTLQSIVAARIKALRFFSYLQGETSAILIITAGGSKCIDPEDCHNNGVCKAAIGGNGNCNCLVEFAGPNCAGISLKILRSR